MNLPHFWHENQPKQYSYNLQLSKLITNLQLVTLNLQGKAVLYIHPGV